MAKINAETITSNMMWRFMERIGAQLVSFGVSILLARLLGPDAYGTVAIVFAIINILQIFVDSGLGNALIQKKDVDNLDYSSVFVFNLGMCAVLYTGLFLAAPLVADIYDMPELTALVRAVGLCLIISGVKNVQQAYVSRQMIFKKFFYATLGGTIIAAAVGVGVAYAGGGVWALVAQHLVKMLVDTLILWVTVKWRPERKFSFQRLKGLIGYGWKLLASAFLDTGYSQLSNLLIGAVYTSADLGYYSKGRQIPDLVVTNINSSINSVLFPALSEAQDDKERLKHYTRRAIKLSSYIMWPMMFGLIACAEPLIEVLLTEEWLPSVPFMQIICFTFGLWPIHTANLEAIKAMGRSDLFLKMEIAKKAFGLTAMLIGLQHSVMGVALASAVTSLVSTVINSLPNWKLMKYTYFEQIMDIAPPLLLSAFMAGIVMQFARVIDNSILLLLVQVPVGALIYVAGSWLFKQDSFLYLLGFIKRILAKRVRKG